jgi:tetratricopeptide (TPR) repeat protein
MVPASFPRRSASPPLSLVGGDAGLAGFDDWLDSACLGGALPPAVAADLQNAAMSYHLDEVAESCLSLAYARAPGHPAVHIALYRFYFYKNRLSEALAVAQRCLAKTAVDLDLPVDWREIAPDHTVFSGHAESYAVAPRFYLFTLKGCAYLSMRLGDLEQGDALLTKLIELDPSDKLGGSVLRGVLDRMGHNDDE